MKWKLLPAASVLVIDPKIPNIVSRSRKLINVATGYKVIDCLFPISSGQRELIIGDRQCGKSILAISTVIEQVSRNHEVCTRKLMYAVVCLVSQKCTNVMRIYELLQRNEVDYYSVIVFAGIIESIVLQFISPLSSTAIAEFFRNQGFHCFVIYDDLSKHAISYRQLSLFLRKVVTREAFPSDIFYIHARLLERSCCLNYVKSSGTLTCFPIIETLSNDLSAFIATNVISITDGQLYLDSVLFGLGICPSVSIEKSVSRVGAKSLDSFWRSVSFKLYFMINEYKQEVDAAVKSVLFKLRKHRWDRVYNCFVQRSSIFTFYNVIVLMLCLHGFCDYVVVKFLKLFEYCLFASDVVILLGFSVLFNYVLMFNWMSFYVFRLLGFNIEVIVSSLCSYLNCVSWLFRYFVQRRLLKVSVSFENIVKSVFGSVIYLTCIKWSWKNVFAIGVIEPLLLVRFVSLFLVSKHVLDSWELSSNGYLLLPCIWVLES